MGAMPDIYDEAQSYRGCDNCKKLQTQNAKLKETFAGCSTCKDQYEAEIVKLEVALKAKDELLFAYESTQSPINPLSIENAKLKEFARVIIEENCWNYESPDGGSIQELAEKLGLIKPHVITEDETDIPDDFEVGDTIYRFTDICKPYEYAQNSSKPERRKG